MMYSIVFCLYLEKNQLQYAIHLHSYTYTCIFDSPSNLTIVSFSFQSNQIFTISTENVKKKEKHEKLHMNGKKTKACLTLIVCYCI